MTVESSLYNMINLNFIEDSRYTSEAITLITLTLNLGGKENVEYE